MLDMHLIIDIRQPHPSDPITSRYASDWVDLWRARHPTDTISYIHFMEQDCPENGGSIIIPPPSFWRRHGRIAKQDNSEIFRCMSFSPYDPYDQSIPTILHRWDSGDILFWVKSHNIAKDRIKESYSIIVPSVSVGEELIELSHIREDKIHPIDYIDLGLHSYDRHLHAQISLDAPYWIYDSGYHQIHDINHLLMGYRDYLTLGGWHLLVLTGYMDPLILRHVSRLISEHELLGSVRITWLLGPKQIEALYMRGAGWISTGSYYQGGPRIALARHHHLPLLLSRISGLTWYGNETIYIHPNHPRDIGKSLIELESTEWVSDKIWNNEAIMQCYEAIISKRG